MKVLVTGAGGLIGSEAVRFFLNKDCEVYGIDNNSRKNFFGEKGDTSSIIQALSKNSNFKNFSVDITDFPKILQIYKYFGPFDAIIHAAAQPSHDWPIVQIQKGNENGIVQDFGVNALGTLHVLESSRRFSPNGVFIQLSTNKVYGDNPNNFNFVEEATRWEYPYNSKEYKNGISENMQLDHVSDGGFRTTKSFFGVSKTAGDQLALEYGRNPAIGLSVGVFRGCCLTGPNHQGVELHGFLNYIVKCAVSKTPYTIFGYKGKQVRDQIHSADVMNVFWEFIKSPRKGEAYNLGGGYENSASVLETINMLENDFGLKMNFTVTDKNRTGDHICYYTDMSKFKSHYPNWKMSKNLKQIVEEIINSETNKI